MDTHKQDRLDAPEQINILAVDDEPSLLRVLKDIFEASSMVMIPAMSAEEAYEKIKTCSPHLIILD
ncbi:MAG: DNA-binding response regulator, partial [bacterium]